ncbi:cupin [Hydrogenobacter thermophilus]|uniref:1,2-dihydroxy-3-keto-5-methylthiopentene dioxygenase n=1 Tax=Hydrogenobacter thermophilus TaxID=940 RepID=UPI0030F4F173
MSLLVLYDEEGKVLKVEMDHDSIVKILEDLCIIFQRWQVKNLPEDASEEDVLKAYEKEIESIKSFYKFVSLDVASITPDHPKKSELRNMFLREHTHSDFEVRFFVDGMGTFYLHLRDKVYAVVCEKGDFISVPANTPHWFDMGKNPSFKAIRFFSIPEGWVANFTGSDISEKIPDHDSIVSSWL